MSGPPAGHRAPGVGAERPGHRPQPRPCGGARDRLRPRPARPRAAVPLRHPRPHRRRADRARALRRRPAGAGPRTRARGACCSPPTTRRSRPSARARRRWTSVLRRPWTPVARDATASSTRATSTPSRGHRLPGAGDGDAPRRGATSGGRGASCASRWCSSRATPRVPAPLPRPGAARRPTPRSCGAPWELAAPYRPQVSEVIPGDDSLLWTSAATATPPAAPLAAFTGRKLRQWPPRFGAARAAEARWDPGLRRAVRRAAGRPRLPRDLPGGGQARPPRRPRLPDRGQPALLAVGRPGDRLRRQPAATPAGATRRAARARGRPATATAGAGSCASKHLAGSAREIRRGEWTARAFLGSLAPAVGRRRDRRRATRARPSPSTARTPAAAPWLSCASAWTAAAPPSRPARAGSSRRWPRPSAAPAAWTDGEADLVYAPDPPAGGVWIPADPAAQAFFEGAAAPSRARRSTAPPA